MLATGDRPEGLLAIPSRNLFVTANEGDGTISIFKLVTSWQDGDEDWDDEDCGAE